MCLPSNISMIELSFLLRLYVSICCRNNCKILVRPFVRVVCLSEKSLVIWILNVDLMKKKLSCERREYGAVAGKQ